MIDTLFQEPKLLHHRVYVLCWFVSWQFLVATCAGEAVSTVSYSRDIQPLLAEHCYECHGPDANSREAELRLDQPQSLFAEREQGAPLVPAQPEESELFRRISSGDDDLRMPPTDSGDRLTVGQVEMIRQWIASGTHWEQHWAFVRPEPQSVPVVADSKWPRNEIDHFILQRLQNDGLSPAPMADKQTLIRRVTLDLTGLPPSPQEVDAFLADDREDSYERLVDRLLASPRYGEQMASVWLDAARYADTYGYQDDGETTMWRWRDWVIDAFNSNMPFDQFTIEQLAGDLLPNPTVDQRIATGFNRNHRHNSEGGSIPEEFRTEYVVDRTSTTGTVWLGLTLGCARCHDHKFDPISQKEFYQLFAFFNNVPEDGRARKEGNTPPMMSAPTKEQLQQERDLTKQLKSATSQLHSLEREFLEEFNTWATHADPTHLPAWEPVTHDLKLRLKLDGTFDLILSDPEEIAESSEQPAKFTAGPQGQAVVLDGRQTVLLGDVGSFSSDDRVTISVWVKPNRLDGVILSKIEYPDDPHEEGYTVLLQEGRIKVYLTSTWADDALRVQTITALPRDKWTHLVVTYDGLQFAKGIQVYFDGAIQPMEIEFDSLFQGFGNEGSLRLGTAGDPGNQFDGAIDDLRIYEEVLTQREISLLGVQGSIASLLSMTSATCSDAEQEMLHSYFLKNFAPASFSDAVLRVTDLEKQLVNLRRSYPTLMIMQELPEPRRTHLLNRGQYDAPGEEVVAGVPEILPSLPTGAPRNRLGLAEWLVSPDNPLTARVIVNRLWQMSFAHGLVRTAEDFGIQGEKPSHPELLDWLALELVHNGWDLQAIRRKIVTSATYRQDSSVSPELLDQDPENRLLARGPRFRLSAEEIRDTVLSASGLLVEKIGGPSVRPYQPPGLWEELSDEEYEQDHGDKLYRRSLYLFWKRTVTHPLMTAFDAPSREVCSVREEHTNTPLQALALMNEDGMIEAARVLAESVLSAPHNSVEDRLIDAFRRVTARLPREEELRLLQKVLQENLIHFQANPVAAEKLASVGEYPHDSTLDAAEVASYSVVANLLLNSDEAVTQH